MRKNTIVAGFGRKGSGKSEFLWERWTSQAPRVLTLDNLGESKERDPNVIETLGMGRTLDMLERAEDFDRWHIAAAIEPEDVRELFAMLAPPLGTGQPSLSLAFGGMAVEIGECDTVMPVSGCPAEILSGLRRGRHYALDLYLATQRPASCAVDVRAMADILFAFQQGSPRDLDAIGDAISEPVADRVAVLQQYHCVYFDRASGEAVELDAERRIVGRIDTLGVRAKRAMAEAGNIPS